MEEPSPSSPGVSPVEPEECFETLLRFTLVSSMEGKLETGLSNNYCANLLTVTAPLPEASAGVPSYPLYKHLSSSLYQCIQSGDLYTASKELIPVPEDHSVNKKEEEWNKLIMEKGSALLSMLKQVDFELHVQEPYFSQLNDGLKTIEGRCAVGNYKSSFYGDKHDLFSKAHKMASLKNSILINSSYVNQLMNRIQPGHLLLFNKCLTLQVQDTRKYASFHEMLETESLAEILPGVSSIKEGVQVYRNFYSEEKEMANGVLAICVKMTTSQPCFIMASILSGLSYSGVWKLLGLAETAGSDPELLPPSESTLLSTFLAPHNPDVKGSTLTTGARALAKHANRSREGYWGAVCGSDSEKNRHAMVVIKRLMAHCSWMNMHIVRPRGIVFEIRTDDGYGARWSGDGSKFVGFLEPYMMDGHSSGWKH